MLVLSKDSDPDRLCRATRTFCSSVTLGMLVHPRTKGREVFGVVDTSESGIESALPSTFEQSSVPSRHVIQSRVKVKLPRYR
jgi:hypothetical protein